jgi:hypothetical protein
MTFHHPLPVAKATVFCMEWNLSTCMMRSPAAGVLPLRQMAQLPTPLNAKSVCQYQCHVFETQWTVYFAPGLELVISI